jgi:hypothetical protein
VGVGDTEWRGDQAGEMGDALPRVDLGTGRTAVAIDAGGGTSCAVLDDGSTKCWGANFNGQLGQGDTSSRGDGPGEMGDALPAIALGTGRSAADVSVGIFHVCAVLDDDTVRCWGGGSSGHLGLDETANRGDQPGEMGDALPRVRFDDHTAPTVTITTPADGATYGRNQAVTVDFSCADLVAVASCVGGVDDGQALDTSTLGSFTFSVTAVDTAGNQTVTSSSYTVAPPGVCDGRTVTVNLAFGQSPTTGNDVILGRPTADTINGLGGDDRICGGGGNDTLNGGIGNDRLLGQAGADRLIGGAGNDRLDGGAGNDRVDGGDGADTLLGNVGVDTLFGNKGADHLDGGTQRDTCDGGPQRDTAASCEVRRGIP